MSDNYAREIVRWALTEVRNVSEPACNPPGRDANWGAMIRSFAAVTALAATHVCAVPLVAQAHAAHAEQLGRVRFATSCRGAAQSGVEHGVAYLHSFWYEQAAEAFTTAAAADSSCAMAFWGQAMSLLHPLWTPPSTADARVAILAIDRGLAAAKSTRERDYLGAIRAYYADYDRTDPGTRLGRYALAMDTVRRHSPSDREAAIFYALALIAVGQANATDTSFTYQKRADSILEPLFRLEPAHPGLAHYLIHTNDVPQLARHGLPAAQRYAAIAPDVPHAQHMPSHIFTRLGLWDDAIASNTRSAAAARAYEVERGLNGMWDQRTHALDYLAYAYLQQGRDTAARLAVRPAPEWPAAEAITHFARAIGAARSSDTALARREIVALAQVESTLTVSGGPQVYWAGQVAIQRLAARAYGAMLVLSPNRARSLFGLAHAAELTGDMATALAKYQEFLTLMAKADGGRPEIAIARRAVASR